jgi:hypothetical protein
VSDGTGNRLGAAAAAWAVLGWSGVLVYAIVRLAAIAAEALAGGLTLLQTAALVANTLALAWSEGYRGFQVKFSPRAAARVLYLREHASWTTLLLAPLFCIGYFRATPRVLRITWIGTLAIVLLVVIVHRLPQPWRGIVDVGVVVGLSWGLVSFLVMSRRALSTRVYPVSPEVPGAAPATLRRGL